jgi:hypothetical protein
MMGEAGYDATNITCESAVKFMLFRCETELKEASIPLPHIPNYRGRTKAFNTKIGLSSGDTIGSSCLCEELTEFRTQCVWK